MTIPFLTVLAVLIAERFLLPHQHLRRQQWFGHWLDWHQSLPIGQGLRQGVPGLLGLLLPPLLLLVLALSLLAGIPALLFSALVLLYCLGPEDLDDQVTRMVQACEAGDLTQAESLATRLDPNAPGVRDPGFSRHMAEAVLLQAQGRIFGVLFWFLLLGPLGALLYRLSQLAVPLARAQSRTALEQPALRLAFVLDWLPARLLAGLFALAGCFEPAVRAWRNCVADPLGDAGKAPVLCAGTGALQLDGIVSADGPGGEPDGSLAKSAMGMVWRALLLMLALLGLVTAAGWVP